MSKERKIKFGGTNLGPGQATWFETLRSWEPDPDNPGQQIVIGGDTVVARFGEVFVAEDLGTYETTGESWAEYHVRTGRATWVEDEKPKEAPKETKKVVETEKRSS